MYQVSKPSSLIEFLSGIAFPDLSKRSIKRMLDSGCCLRNGVVERFGSKWLKKNDMIQMRICIDQPIESLSVIYQNDDYTCVNKPSGMTTQEVVSNNFLDGNHYCVHRLDKGTSGVLLIARNRKIESYFIDMFRRRLMNKTYLAIVKGQPKQSEGIIHTQLYPKGRFSGQTIYASAPNGKEAITHWKCLKRYKLCSLVELSPKTGRTHQLRVHMSEMGHPVVGDFQYGRHMRFPGIQKEARLCLHAYALSSSDDDSNQKLIDVKAPIPEYFIAYPKGER